jgi:glycosyltransferase involved in cell wall biosynthesis
VGRYIKAADCIVLPGTGGLVLNEAVLFNKPFIVSDADGTENDLLINGFNGLKFLPDCKASLANALAEMAENLNYFQENAAQVRELVTKRSNVDMMVSTFLKVLNKLSHENNTSSRSASELYENSTYHKGD